MERISLLDDLFLWLERRSQPMHVAGLMILEKPEGASSGFVSDLVDFMREHRQPSEPFNLRVKNKRFGHYWEVDKNFDLDHHFRHVALPKPAGVKELLTFVSIEHSNLLDRNRPLWESYLIEGVNRRHFAIYDKVHHSMLDGVSGVRHAMRLFGIDPEKREMPPTWQLPPYQPPASAEEAITGGRLRALKDLASNAARQIRTVPNLTKALYKTVKQASSDPEYAAIYKAPACKLNEPITGSRRFVAQSYDRARVKAIADRTRSTSNDVILALCGTVLRNYLLSMDALPEQPLISLVPMSLRTDDSIGGNQVAAILANLGTHKADPLERLDTVKQSVEQAKERYAAMTREEIINYTALMLAPTGLTVMTGLMPQWQAFNVIISNVPGPTKSLYWNGARLERYYPVSIISNHMALNITLVSYEDRLEFGIVGCRRTLPSLQRLLGLFDDALVELEREVGIEELKPNKRVNVISGSKVKHKVEQNVPVEKNEHAVNVSRVEERVPEPA